MRLCGCVSLLAIILCLFSFLNPLLETAYGWGNGGFSSNSSHPDYGTHDWIAHHALDWLPYEEKSFIVENLAAYLYGTELPDNSRATDGIGDTTKHHIYYRSDGRLEDDASAKRAQEEFNLARSLYRSGAVSEAVKRLGAMTHYISDMAVFSHVMGASTDWGTETHHSDYENYVNGRTNNYDDEFNVFLSFDGTLETVSAYNATLRLAFDTTFDVDGGLTCLWMDSNYDWDNPVFRNRCGGSINLAVNLVTDVLHTFYLAVKLEAFDFTFSLTPRNGTVQHEETITAIINVTLLSGSPLPVYLSASGLPNRVSVSFTPSSNVPPFTSSLEIRVTNNTPAGTYEIKIVGRSDNLTKIDTYMLTVKSSEIPVQDVLIPVLILGFITVLLLAVRRIKHL